MEITEDFNQNRGYDHEFIAFDNSVIATNTGSVGSSSPSVTKAGSMSRFALTGDFLQAIDRRTLKSFQLNPLQITTSTNLNRNAETLFPRNNELFIGTTTGMIIYDVSNPSTPNHLSDFNHARSCDPVVVDGDYAYVTLRPGSPCQGFSNQLDVINISSITSPYLVKSYQMSNPHGLGIENNTLFICDGEDGLKVYDISNKEEIDQNQLYHFEEMNGFGVIPHAGNLLFIGSDGLAQYDYSDPSNMILLSTISL